MSKREKEPLKSPFEDAEYVGNVWGWKYSYISLAIILFLGIIVVYRSCQLGVDPFTEPQKKTVVDTTITGE